MEVHLIALSETLPGATVSRVGKTSNEGREGIWIEFEDRASILIEAREDGSISTADVTSIAVQIV